MAGQDRAGADIRAYDTLAELYAQLGLPIEQEAEFTIHRLAELHRNRPMQSPLFRANYYSFVFIRRGRGQYTIDSRTYETCPGTIYFTNPGHIKGFGMVEVYEGYLITMSERFLKQHIRETVFDDFPFLLAETVPPGYLKPEEFEVFCALTEQMYTESQAVSPYKYKILSSLMVVLLLKIKARFWSSYNPREEGDRSSHIVREFKKLLETHVRALVAGHRKHMLQVQDFAERQHLHPNYFTTVIKSKTGKSVSNWVAEKLVAEAQALLIQSTVSAKEIAYRLGFSEPGHFSRFFKKHTGSTPGAFRRAHRHGSTS